MWRHVLSLLLLLSSSKSRLLNQSQVAHGFNAWQAFGTQILYSINFNQKTDQEDQENRSSLHANGSVISTSLYPLMIDNTSKTVIKECLDQFGSRPMIKKIIEYRNIDPILEKVINLFWWRSQVLYDNVILFHMDLAIDEVRCRSLNQCISSISGKHKIILLESTADDAVFLSNDRYGNYVVQQAMFYGNDHVIAKILFRLCGHFTQQS